MIQYQLGRSIAQIVPFYRRIKDKEVITTKLLIVFGIVAIVKFSVLILWPL